MATRWALGVEDVAGRPTAETLAEQTGRSRPVMLAIDHIAFALRGKVQVGATRDLSGRMTTAQLRPGGDRRRSRT